MPASPAFHQTNSRHETANVTRLTSSAHHFWSFAPGRNRSTVAPARGRKVIISWSSSARVVGLAAAAFFILIFPGNISQYVNQIDAFGLNTDQARFSRLFFQPVLVLWALWSTDGWRVFFPKKKPKLGIRIN